MNSQEVASLSIIFNNMLSRAVRMEGLIGIMVDNCKACSAFPDQIKPLETEMDGILHSIEQLVESFVMSE